MLSSPKKPEIKFKLRDGATALSTWNRALNNPQRDISYVSIFIEPEILVTSHVSTRDLFALAPALQRFWDDQNGRIVLPAGSVDEWSDATEDVVNELVKAAKEGKQPFIMIAWDPLWLINAHRALVLFGRDSEAVQCMRALWTLLGHCALTPEQVEWIWSTFSPHVSAIALDNKSWPEGPYICPNAGEYVQAMLWQLLNLCEEKKLDDLVVNYLELNADLKRSMDKRYRKFKLKSKYKETESAVRPNPFQGLVTNGVKKLRINEAGESKDVGKLEVTAESDDSEDETEDEDEEESKSFDNSAKKSLAPQSRATTKAAVTPLPLPKPSENLPAFNLNRSGSGMPTWNKATPAFTQAAPGKDESKDEDEDHEPAKPPKSHLKKAPAFISGGFQLGTGLNADEIKKPVNTPTNTSSIFGTSTASQVFGAAAGNHLDSQASTFHIQPQQTGTKRSAEAGDSQPGKQGAFRFGSNSASGPDTGPFASNAGNQPSEPMLSKLFGPSIRPPTDLSPSTLPTSNNIGSIFGGGSPASTTPKVTFGEGAPQSKIPSSLFGGGASSGGLGSSIFGSPNPFGNNSFRPSDPTSSSIFGPSAAATTFNPPPTTYNFSAPSLSAPNAGPQVTQPWNFTAGHNTSGSGPLNFQGGGSGGGDGSNMFDFQGSGGAGGGGGHGPSGRRFARATGAKGGRKRG
ncbi:hypothetical protein BDV96DRAFT_568949 [Lophiotrema nucula]|uniref:Uncharacterized protein n=1 Tax=Lophiotrema nucula TaxID=690887 RepID=A0A6A5ZHK4_9PLEO|nr:hypothetical protein BDV96DRAFT_568949 [Lophiotrema nucula]